MRTILWGSASVVAIALVCGFDSGLPGRECVWAADAPTPKEQTAQAKPGAKPEEKKLPEWEKVVDGAKRLEGVFPLYFNEKQQKLFMEIKQEQFDKEIILPIAIARGAGLMYLGGIR